MGIGYLLHFAPDGWQDACCRGVVRLPLLGKALLLVALIYLVIQIKSSDIQPFYLLPVLRRNKCYMKISLNRNLY